MDPNNNNNNNNNMMKKKHSMGRRKIEIKKIEDRGSRQVTFSKRRTGLFKKASELCVLSGSEAAIFVASPGGKIFTFGHPNVEAIINRYMHRDNNNNNNLDGSELTTNLEQFRVLEGEKGRLKATNNIHIMINKKIDEMDLEELEKYRECLKELKKEVELKAMEKKLMEEINHQDFQEVNSKPSFVVPHHDHYF